MMDANQPPKHNPDDAPLHYRGLRCTHCGYELTGAAEARCPECGHTFNPVELRSYQTDPPRTMWVWSLLFAILFPPLGLVALSFSIRAEKARRRSRLNDAYDLAERAQLWLLMSGVASAVMFWLIALALAQVLI